MIFRKFLNGNEWYWRLARTILQGIIGVVIANIDMIIEPLQIDNIWKAMIVAVVMAILSPLMAELGKEADVIAGKRAAKKAAKLAAKEESKNSEEKNDD